MTNFTNDNEMTYSVNTHRYVLTENYFNTYHNVNLKDILLNGSDVDGDAVAKQFLERVSRQFYTFILSTVPSVEKAQYLFSTNQYRDGIKECMLELGYAFLINNYDPSVLWEHSDKKMVPSSVETMALNYGLFNRHWLRLPNGWKDTKGVDW